ncbi:MAG: thiamine phosphate synthase [Pseudohongiella sp.]|nr:thiamine phosphate synthase [Pseudohongiella sp.]MDO9521690.1 thiamine phosphate synthase [Pseudohongiella sp.]MDP2128281.1 thiamine phosphate synthase [Pseudohongiella sp.]
MTSPHRLSGVYAITDDELLAAEKLLPAVEQALKGGVSVLQYRSKSNGDASKPFALRQQQAAALTRLCHQYQALLLVNDDVDLCQAAGADGVHLGQGDVSLAEARRRLGPSAVIGITCHNNDDLVEAAQRWGADYIALGRFFRSATKPMAPAASIEDLKRIRQLTQLPIVAIGGVNADNGRELITAGADMLAVIHYLFSSDQVQQRAQTLSLLFTHARNQ